MKPYPSDEASSRMVREAMSLRQRAEDRSTRTLMCAGRVEADGVVVYFPGPEQGPIIVAKGQVEPVEKD